MDKILAILNIIVFGILFISGIYVVFIKKRLNVNMEASNKILAVMFGLFCLPVLLGLSIVF